MPPRFFRSDNRPEQVFDRTGHRHHFMRLQLRKIDDLIGLVIGSSEANGAKRTDPLQFNSFIEFNKSSPTFTRCIINSAFLCDAYKTAETGAVANQYNSSRLPYK